MTQCKLFVIEFDSLGLPLTAEESRVEDSNSYDPVKPHTHLGTKETETEVDTEDVGKEYTTDPHIENGGNHDKLHVSSSV